MKKIYLLSLLILSGSIFSFAGDRTPNANSSRTQLNQKNGNTTQQLSSIRVNGKVPGSVALEVARNGSPSVEAIYYSDNFDGTNDTTSLKARNYKVYYRGGGAQGTSATWFQGNATVFPALNGPTTGYVGSNYNSVTGANNIDNWLVLPKLAVASGDVLSFFSRSPTASTFADSIKVMYSAVGDSVPEAASWVMLGNFKSNTTGAFLQNTFSAPAAGATARFAIRYAVVDGGPSGANSDYIGIDSLTVGTAALVHDASMVKAFPTQYSVIPLKQVTPINISGTVHNNGGFAETGVGFNANVFESHDNGATFAPVFTGASATASVAIGATSAVLSAGSYTPIDTGLYAFQYISTMASADANHSNDTLTSFLFVDDTTYNRSYAEITGTLDGGLGVAANTNSLAQMYDLPSSPAIVSSVSFFIFQGTGASALTDTLNVTVWSGSGGLPSTALGTSANYILTVLDTPSAFITLPLPTPVTVTGPKFGVSLNDMSVSNATYLGYTSDIFTAGTAFYKIAAGAWTTVESASFPIAYFIRPNFVLSNKVDENTMSKGIEVFPNPSNGRVYVINTGNHSSSYSIEVLNNMGQIVFNKVYSNFSSTQIDLSNQASGVYTMRMISDANVVTKSIVISGK